MSRIVKDAKSNTIIRQITPLEPYQALAIRSPFTHFVFWAGIAGGKTFTGSHFIILNIIQRPELTFLVGANTHDQLSQATLRELFYWLHEYGFEYTIDRRPPSSWGRVREFKDYQNVLTIRDTLTGHVTTGITRVLSNPDSIRGIELSYYWIDETRDTEEYALDIILGRLRESDYIRGLITTTTNGEDWLYKRVMNNKGKRLYGSLHVQTYEAVKAGHISQEYYDGLLGSYSELMAQQELFAQHVNVWGGRAYYAASQDNRMRVAPWGQEYPDPERPLIVGCDFNFSPAPCIWSIGQESPDDDRVHWFGELCDTETSSASMARRLAMQYPGFFYRIFGDASGNVGTTSNAGQTDYDQIGLTLNELGCSFTIDCESHNPLVKDRIENVNGLLKDSTGNIRMTYCADRCPNLDADFKMVGWKLTTQRGRGKLDDGGDVQRTHASDGVGYACWKVRPPGRRGSMITSTPSMSVRSVSHAV